jgi:hypothetical protein
MFLGLVDPKATEELVHCLNEHSDHGEDVLRKLKFNYDLLTESTSFPPETSGEDAVVVPVVHKSTPFGRRVVFGGVIISPEVKTTLQTSGEDDINEFVKSHIETTFGDVLVGNVTLSKSTPAASGEDVVEFGALKIFSDSLKGSHQFNSNGKAKANLESCWTRVKSNSRELMDLPSGSVRIRFRHGEPTEGLLLRSYSLSDGRLERDDTFKIVSPSQYSFINFNF